MIDVAALVRRVGEPGQPADFASVAEVAPGEELHDEQPGAVRADPAQLDEAPHLGDSGVVADPQECRPRRPQLAEACRVLADHLPFPREAGHTVRWQGCAVPQARRGEMGRQRPEGGERHAVAGKHALDPIR